MGKRFCLIALSVLIAALCGCSQTSGKAPSSAVSQMESGAGSTASSEAASKEPVPTAKPTPEPSPGPEAQRNENWVADIKQLQKSYISRHENPFYYCSVAEFYWKIDQLIEKVPELSDNDIVYEMAKIIRGMGDAHSLVQIPQAFGGNAFPIQVRMIDGKLYLTQYAKGYEQFEPYLVRQIVAVNGVDADYLIQKEEELGSKHWFQSFFFPSFLEWAKAGSVEDGYTLWVLNDNEEVEKLELPVVPKDQWSEMEWVSDENYKAISCLNVEGNWVKYDEMTNTTHLAFYRMNMPPSKEDYEKYYPQDEETLAKYEELYGSDTVSYVPLFEECLTYLTEHPDCKFIVDLRDNGGGYGNIMPIVEDYVKKYKAVHPAAPYVLIDGGVASGGVLSLGYIQDAWDDAVSVGQPTGQFYIFFANADRSDFTLTHSQIKCRVSTVWSDFGTGYGDDRAVYDENAKLYEWENTVLPDVYIANTIENIRQGRDTALEWVLAR